VTHEMLNAHGSGTKQGLGATRKPRVAAPCPSARRLPAPPLGIGCRHAGCPGMHHENLLMARLSQQQRGLGTNRQPRVAAEGAGSVTRARSNTFVSFARKIRCPGSLEHRNRRPRNNDRDPGPSCRMGAGSDSAHSEGVGALEAQRTRRDPEPLRRRPTDRACRSLSTEADARASWRVGGASCAGVP